MGDEERANNFYMEAQKKMESTKGFMSKMFGAHSKIEDACDLFQRAGNAYKMAKKWSAAGNAFCELAKIQLNQLQSKHEAATQYVEAANCYRKSDHQEAINCLELAVEIFTDMGRFAIAAKHHVTIAEIYESNLMNVDMAITHFTQAADYYKGEESSSAANKCLLKVAMHSATQENYNKAISLYEEVAAVALESSLLKYSAREYLFKASLCQLCHDMDVAKGSIEKYCQMFPAFEDSREMKLLTKILTAFEEDNIDNYTEAVREYDSISRLDQWYTTILLRVKSKIGSGGIAVKDDGEPDLS